MTPSAKRILKFFIAALALVALVFVFLRSIRSTNSEPYAVSPAALTGWTVAAGGPRDPGAVVLQAPQGMAQGLFQQIFKRTMQSLVAPSAPTLPIVLRDEFADSLQGVHAIGDIVRIAREAGLESARFEPICLAQRRESVPGRSAELFFVAFNPPPEFLQFRQQLPPLHQEHAGTGVFDPAALEPILMIGGTDENFSRWWPIRFDRDRDCVAPLLQR